MLTLDLSSHISHFKRQSHAIIFPLVGNFSMFSENELSRLIFTSKHATTIRVQIPRDKVLLGGACTKQNAEVPFSLDHKIFNTT